MRRLRVLTWAFLVSLVSSASFAAGAKKYFNLLDFSGGLNSNYSSLTIADNEVHDALNVYFDKDNAVTKRKGYTLYGSTTTTGYQGMWQYVDATNNYWMIVRGSTAIYASPGNGQFTVKVATCPTTATSFVSAVNAFGKIYFVDNQSGVYSWDGSATQYISGSPKGTLITEFHGRLWVAGLAVPNQNYLYASAYLDGATWSTGALATDPALFQVGLNDRADGITTLYAGYNDVLYIFKNLSISGLTGYDQTDYTLRTLTKEAGCIDAGSLQAWNGYLIFMSLRGIEQFDGAFPVLISQKIKDKINSATFSSFNQRTYSQSTAADWQADTMTPTGYLTISGNTVILSSANAVSFNHNFSIGTLTNVCLDGTSLDLCFSDSVAIKERNTSYSPIDYDCSGDSSISQSFTAQDTYTLTAVDIYTQAAYTELIQYHLKIKSDNSGSPGTDLSDTLFTAINGLVNHININPTPIIKGRRYWIQVSAAQSATFGYCWMRDLSTSHTEYSAQGNTVTQSINYCSVNYGRHRYQSGSYVSGSYDVGYSSSQFIWNWNPLISTSVLWNGSISFETQVSSDSVTWDSLVSINGSSVPTSSLKRYIRYKASLLSPDVANTPVLQGVSFGTSLLKSPNGTLTSIIDIGASASTFGTLAVNSDLTSGGSLSYSVCTSANSNMTSATCANQIANAQITAPVARYVQVYSTFTASSPTDNPILRSFVLSWSEGTLRPKMTSVVYDTRYWISLTTATADTANDATIVLAANKGNLVWSFFDIKASAFGLFKNLLYHTDAGSTGNVYQDDQGYNDNGQAINSYIVTKDYAPDGLVLDKYFDRLHIAADSLGNYSLNTSFSLDRNPTWYSLSSVNQSEQTGLINLSLPLPIDAAHQVFGKTIAFKFSNSSIDQSLNLYGGTLSYRVRPIVGNVNAN